MSVLDGGVGGPVWGGGVYAHVYVIFKKTEPQEHSFHVQYVFVTRLKLAPTRGDD